MAPENKKPMSLEDLPAYLNSVKDDNIGRAPIVNTGQIVSTTNEIGWLQSAIFGVLLCMVLGMGGLMTYTMMSTKNITINVDINQSDNPSQTIQKIISDSGGKVLSVEKNADSTYEVKLETRKSRRSFLEWVRGYKEVKRVEIEE